MLDSGQKKQWGLRMTAPRPAVPNGAEKQVIVAACEAFIRDVLKPRFLPQIRPTEWNYVVDIHGGWAAGRYRFIQRYRSGMEHNRGEEFDAPFARIDRMERDSFDVYWMRHTGKWWRLHTGVTPVEALRLTAVEADTFEADEPEPMPGIGPMTAALEAFAAFFGIDPDLVQVAAERPAIVIPSVSTSADVGKILLAMTDSEKTEILARLYDGDTHVALELRARVRDRMAVEADAPPVVARTVGELRARARALGLAREHAAANKLAAERKRQVEEAEKARRVRLDTIARRGESVWRDVEAEIERRNATGYDSWRRRRDSNPR
jgi:hypothetical protein